MAVLYDFHKIVGKKSNISGMYVARTKMTQTVNLSTLADRIQRNSTAKRSDVLAVLSEFVEVLCDELQASHAVKIDRLGTFRIGIKAKSIADPTVFNVNKHVKKIHVNFFPEITGGGGKGIKRNHALVQGVQLKLFDPAVEEMKEAKKKTEENSQTSNP